jgi:cytochrome c
MKFTKLAVLGFTLMAAPAFADGHATGSAEDGKGVFKKCKACHSIVDADGGVIVKGGKNAPNLYGVYNRVAGTQEDFAKKYGKSLIKAGEAGLLWNEADFITYVADPKKFLKAYLSDKKAKSKMSFKLKKEQAAKDVWAFIVANGPNVESAEANTATD